MIELADVTRRYGDKTAVEQLSLRIPRGEIFALLGPNGAGKTTTVKMLAGLLQPTAGVIRLAGYDLRSARRDAAARLGYVPDEPFLYEKLSGREFLEFVAEMRGLSRDEALRQIARQVTAFELDRFLDELTETYSHGMKQRVVFASALLHRPAVLILDEPMVGLDPRSARMVKDLLRHEAQQGMTVFMSTHSLSVAEEIADRIGILDHGRLNFLGTLDELRQLLAAPARPLETLFLQLTDGNGNRVEEGAAQ